MRSAVRDLIAGARALNRWRYRAATAIRTWITRERVGGAALAVTNWLLDEWVATGQAVGGLQHLLADQLHYSLRTVERAFSALRRLGVVVEIPGLRVVPPHQLDNGEWESSEKVWALVPERAFEAFGITRPDPGEYAVARERAGGTIPTSVAGPKGSQMIIPRDDSPTGGAGVPDPPPDAAEWARRPPISAVWERLGGRPLAPKGATA